MSYGAYGSYRINDIGLSVIIYWNPLFLALVGKKPYNLLESDNILPGTCVFYVR